MTGNRERRARFVVNRPLQSRIVLSISWPFVLVFALSALAVGFFCVELVQEIVEADVDLPSLVPFLFTVMGLLVASAGLLVLHLYRFSHRIAGPMVNVRRCLGLVRDGSLHTRIRLRKHDLLVEVADDLNAFLTWLEQHPPTGIEVRSPQQLEPTAHLKPTPDLVEPRA